MLIKQTAAESKKNRLDAFVEIIPEAGCWIFMGATDAPSHKNKRLSYGKFWINEYGRSIQAHRASWLIYHGDIPAGKIVMHICDVPECCNPNHLKLGTYKENTSDMFSKKRAHKMIESRSGEKSNFSKLTQFDVINIFNDSRLQRIIAKDYGVTQTCVSRIKLKKVWKHLHQNLDTSTAKTESQDIR